ncbi:hypothetical protein [Aestuariivirga sp.]|uniref:hypothetical protein n=1 Tax=Aestuariivirga sp. TaxID=2650926 RepID=UPI003BAB7620
MMRLLSSLRSAAGAAVLLGLALSATPALADDFRIDDAWKAALQDNEGILDEKQQAVINGIAFSAAAALLCDGIDIDGEKVAKATTAVLAGGPADLTDDEQLERYSNILLMLGTAKGILLAEGALHKDDFCASANQQKADTQVANFWK